MPLTTDMMRTTETACTGGMIWSHHPSAKRAVPKPANPLMKPPQTAPASKKKTYSTVT